MAASMASAGFQPVPSHASPSEAEDAEAVAEYALVERARGGDRDAFGVLVERYQGRAYRLALRILRDPTLAEDAVQDALIKAHAGLARFQGRCAFYTWLYRLVTNQCLDLRRRNPSRRWVSPDGPLGIDEQVAPRIHDPAYALQQRQLRDRLTRGLERLGDDARRTLLLREVDELSYAEIAAVEEIPVGTVMSRLYYARRRLRDLLGGADDEAPSAPSAAVS